MSALDYRTIRVERIKRSLNHHLNGYKEHKRKTKNSISCNPFKPGRYEISFDYCGQNSNIKYIWAGEQALFMQRHFND